MSLQYNRGMGGAGGAAGRGDGILQTLDRSVSGVAAAGTLSQVMRDTAHQAFPRPSPEKGALPWFLAGHAMFILTHATTRRAEAAWAVS